MNGLPLRMNMNQELREIAKEAGFVLWEDELWKPEGAVIDWSSNYDKELEKFAQILMERMKK